jgi:hypothetical protein
MAKYYINNGSGSTRTKKASVSLRGIGGSSMNVEYADKKVIDCKVGYYDAMTTILEIDPLLRNADDGHTIKNANLISVTNTGSQTAVVALSVPDWTLGADADDSSAGATSVMQWLLKPGASMMLPGTQAICSSAVATNAANGEIEYGYDNAAKSASDVEYPMQKHPIVFHTTGGKVQTNTVANIQMNTKQTDWQGSYNYGDVTAAGSNLVRGLGDGNSGLFNHAGMTGGATASCHYVPGSIAVRFMDPGYAKFGLNGQTSSSKSGLAANTAYRFKFRIDAGTYNEINFTTDSTDTTWGGGVGGTSVLGIVNSKLRSAAPWKDTDGVEMPIPQFTIENGDIYLRWGSAKKTSVGGNATALEMTAGSGAGSEWWGVGKIPASATFESSFQGPLLKHLNRTGEMMFDDGYGNLVLAGKKVGEVEYNSGMMSFKGAPAFSNFEYTATRASALGGSQFSDFDETTSRVNVITRISASSTNLMRDAKLKVVALTI